MSVGIVFYFGIIQMYSKIFFAQFFADDSQTSARITKIKCCTWELG